MLMGRSDILLGKIKLVVDAGYSGLFWTNRMISSKV